MRFRRAGAICCVPALLLAACAGCGPRTHGPSAHTVTIHGLRFVPESLTVATGDTVVWDNQDIVPHSATEQSHVFDTDTIAPHAQGRAVLARAGRFEYQCIVHPDMHGVLVAR